MSVLTVLSRVAMRRGSAGRAAPGLWVACLSLLAPALVHADMLNLTGAETAPNIAEITVLDDRVNVRLEVYIGDLDRFIDLVPDALLKDGGAGRPSESERMAHFATRVLGVRGPDGEPLPAELVMAEPRLRVDRKSPFAGAINPTTGQRVPEPPADKRVLYAEIDYPFDGRPEFLTIFPPADADGNTLVTIGFIAFHKAVPVIDFRYLSAASTLRLDWGDPWYSRFDNRNLKRHHKSALMSFLYVEPREVRHEVLIRVRDLEDWIDLGLDGTASIDSGEQTMIKNRARRFLAGRNPLSIDGEAREPEGSRAEFVRVSPRGLTVVEEGQPIELSTAILGVILSYPVDNLPEGAVVEWDLFNERILRVPASSIDPAGPLATFVEPESPNIEWQNFLRTYVEPTVTPVTIDAGDGIRIPVASLVLALVAIAAAIAALRTRRGARIACSAVTVVVVVGAALLHDVGAVTIRNPLAGPPDAAIAAEIVGAALGNVHVAYLETREDRLARALDGIVATDNVANVRAELDRALAIRVAGGGTARVRAVEDLVVEEVAPLSDRPGFSTLAEWTAMASAGHWGHQHERRIRFRALMELARDGDTWKIADLTVVDATDVSGV